MPTYEEYEFPSRPRRHRDTPTFGRNLLLIIVILGVGSGLGYYVFRNARNKPHDFDAELREVTARGEHDTLERERIRVFKTTSPSVVNVDIAA
jgi:hypothetical protein